MLEINTLRQEKESIIEGLKKRHFDATEMIDHILNLDSQWRSNKTQMEQIASQMNQLSKSIGELFKSGQREEATVLKNQTQELKQKEHTLKEIVDGLEKEINDLMYQIPNIPHNDVVKGKNADDNQKIFENGNIPSLDSDAIPHWELAKKHDLIDFELGVKVSGSGFPFYVNKGAKIQRALINFFLQEASNAGYKEYLSPILVNQESALATGQLPDKEGQMYHAADDDFYLIPTGEVPLTNIYSNVILPDEDFSIKITGHTPCFRREAGSYGKDVRGLNRLHQFDKVEIVRIEHPDNTEQALNEMVSHIKNLLEKLKLPYRVLRLCGGDMGFTSAMTYDFEVYSAAQKKWLEVSSVSRFDTYQSNRLKLRYKGKDKKNHLCHTLNGSALALPRILASILENNQKDNKIIVPEVLHEFCGFSEIS